MNWFTRRGMAAALSVALSLAAIPAWAGSIVTREFRSAQLDRPWSYSIYLPDGYEGGNLRYPVLYLLHGNGGSLNEWPVKGNLQATADRLMRAGEIPPAIIVMPDAGTSWYVDRKERMESAVLQDLIPDVERSFRTLTTREGRLIGGLSMGGYGALRFVMLRPDLFAAAALLSPAIYDPEPPETSSARRVGVFGAEQYDTAIWTSLNWPVLWDAFLAKGIAVPMYINSGDDDDFFIEGEATRLYDRLRRAKQPAQLRIVDGAHVWPVWESTIGDAMRYVFSFSARPALPEPR
ncbi:esterase family protein [Roseomonas sp. OT10]|uniref:alpha/beta hydrolase n=1 Tax=Roseomonas cutis TaxID=2897332 RepID=UPI001E62CE14|nr:alpha/beta hydrolase family protein [Roseomonas sp. OT10]UFN50363.1 esterase family protein [Roseomonas sp. OT10]